MEGIKILYKESEVKFGIENGSATVHIFTKENENSLYVDSVNNIKSTISVWHDFTAIKIDDSIEIILTDVEDNTDPIKVETKNISKTDISKLALFHKLENELIKRRLI